MWKLWTLSTWTEAWQAIPGVSNWVLGIIKWGYTLQFARRPPQFGGVVSTSVQQDWFFSLDLKDAYFHIQIAPQHRRFLWFAFVGVAYQYTVLLFGLSLAPRTFTKCMDTALSRLRQTGIHILNYLGDWLILAQSEDEFLSHRSGLLSHLECLGLWVNFAKIALSPSQRISFLGTVIDWTCHIRTCTGHSAARGFIQTESPDPSKHFRGCWASWPQRLRYFTWACFTCSPFSTGWNLEFRHRRLRVKVSQACVAALAPIKNISGWNGAWPLGMVYRRKVVSTDASNLGWGALCDSKPAFGLWSKKEGHLHINRLEMLAVCLSLRTFLSDLNRHHVLVQYFYFIWWMYT